MKQVVVETTRGSQAWRPGGVGVELVQFVAEDRDDSLILYALAAMTAVKDVADQLRVMLRASGWPLPPRGAGQ